MFLLLGSSQTDSIKSRGAQITLLFNLNELNEKKLWRNHLLPPLTTCVLTLFSFLDSEIWAFVSKTRPQNCLILRNTLSTYTSFSPLNKAGNNIASVRFSICHYQFTYAFIIFILLWIKKDKSFIFLVLFSFTVPGMIKWIWKVKPEDTRVWMICRVVVELLGRIGRGFNSATIPYSISSKGQRPLGHR